MVSRSFFLRAFVIALMAAGVQQAQAPATTPVIAPTAADLAVAASPIAADGRLYFANEDGDVFVVRAGKDYEQIAVN